MATKRNYFVKDDQLCVHVTGDDLDEEGVKVWFSRKMLKEQVERAKEELEYYGGLLAKLNAAQQAVAADATNKVFSEVDFATLSES